jgi:hypothetical protein
VISSWLYTCGNDGRRFPAAAAIYAPLCQPSEVQS